MVVPRLGRAGRADDDGSRHRARRSAPAAIVRIAVGRQRAPVVRRVHERHDGTAEGCGARARRLPREDRRGGRVPDRSARGRAACSGSPTSAGSWGRGRSSARSPPAARSCSTTARPTSPAPTGCGRSSNGTASTCSACRRRLIRALMAHGDEPVRARTTSRRCASSRRPASRGTRRRGGGTSTSSAAAVPGHQHLGRHRGRRVLPVAARRAADVAVLARRSGARDGGRRVRRRRPVGARRGRRARVHEAVAGHDARVVPRSRSATSRRTGRGTRACGGTATSRASPTTGSGSCTAAPTTRSSSRASGSGRPRSRPPSSRIPRWSKPPRSACPTS